MLCKKLPSRLLVLALGLLAVVSTGKSQGGTPGLWLEYTNMTPNGDSDPASKQCSNAIKDRLRVTFHKVDDIAEAERRRRAKSKVDAADFMSWGKNEIQVEDDFTFVVAVDCRPITRQLDVLLVGKKGSVAFRLRSAPISAKRLNWLADDVALRAETMFWR